MSDPASISNGALPLVTTGEPGGQGAFSTSGQISWTGLANSAFSTTVGVLSRVSAAGVDPYTVVVGQQLGAQFQLTSAGRWNIQEALNKLQSYRALGVALWFGFGVNHLVRIMGRTEEGQLCLALCASLSECYDITVAAEILIEMVNTSRAPASLRPSILEWKSLLEASSGLLSTSTFAELAERYMNLHPSSRGLSYESLQGSITGRGCSSPESVARALLAIGQVTRGDLTSITIIGGSDAGWLAAFSEWHFQLSVKIIHGDTGEVLHCSRNEIDYVQLLMIYEDKCSQNNSHVQTIGKTYRLHDATLLIQRDRSDRYGGGSVAGRVEWKYALTSAFGSDFKRLLSNHRAFGGAIGNIARIMKAIASAENTIGVSFRQSCKYYEVDSYGGGFITNLIHWFPELTPLEDIMKEAAKQDVSTAIARYEAYITALKIACDCVICKGVLAAQETYCLVLILEVIVAVGRTMSTVNLPVVLAPSRLGFEVLYGRQFLLRREVEEGSLGDPRQPERHKELGSAFFAVEGDARRTSALFDALEIFSGRAGAYHFDDSRTCAVSKHGICVYWQALGKASNGHLTGRVTVLPGQIELNEKSYSLMIDLLGRPLQISDALGWASSLTFSDISVLVKETTGALQLSLEIRQSNHNDAQKICISPALAINEFLCQQGLVVCEGRGCTKIEHQAVIKDERPGYKMYQFGEVEIEALEVSRLQQWILGRNPGQLIFCDKECIDCCLRTALEFALGNTRLIIRCLDN
jgi:hypothetical protein